MTKDYKPGDRVRMIKDTRVSTLGKSFYKQGEEYIVDVSVMGMFSDYDLKLEHSEYSCGYVMFEDVELVTEFSLSDIKTGMLVLDANNTLRICIGGSLISINKGGLLLSQFTLEPGRDQIVKVFNEPTSKDGLCADLDFWLERKNFLSRTTCIYEYKPTKKMTWTEIEKELGYKVEVVCD